MCDFHFVIMTLTILKTICTQAVDPIEKNIECVSESLYFLLFLFYHLFIILFQWEIHSIHLHLKSIKLFSIWKKSFPCVHLINFISSFTVAFFISPIFLLIIIPFSNHHHPFFESSSLLLFIFLFKLYCFFYFFAKKL